MPSFSSLVAAALFLTFLAVPIFLVRRAPTRRDETRPVTAPRAWRHTAYRRDGAGGPAMVHVKPDRLLVELTILIAMRTIASRPSAPIEIRARDVVSIEMVTRFGRRRCHVVTGLRYERHEHWLSAWVGEEWERLAVDLPPIARR